MANKKDHMKRQLLKTVESLKEDGIDLSETPALFKWSYDEQPWIKFQLLITETEQANLNLEEPVH